jgi:hypothetical protein
MGAEHPIMQENLPVERLVRKALRAEEPMINKHICLDILILSIFSSKCALACYHPLYISLPLSFQD